MKHSKTVLLAPATLAVASFAALFTSTAQANLGEVYGFGSRAAALGGATAAGGFDGFAAYYNPAGVTFLKERRFQLSVGLTYNDNHFKAIDGVVIENNYTSNGIVRGNVSTDDYRPTFGAVLGATVRLLPQLWNLSAGLVAFAPLKQLAYIDSGQPYIPEFVLHRARTQRPQAAVAVGVEPLEGLSVGGGVNTIFSMTSSADVQVQTDASKPSTMTLNASVKPKLIPFAGVLYSHKHIDRSGNGRETQKAGAWSLGVVYRMEGKSEIDMSLRTTATALNPLGALPVRFNAGAAMYYDPQTVEVGATVQYTDWGRLFGQVGYEFWNQFEAPGLSVTPTGGIVMSSGGPASFDARNIIVPRVGHEARIGPAAIRLGYSYRPSIFKEAPNGAGNYLDPGRDIYSVGFGWTFDNIAGSGQPLTVDSHFMYQAMRGVSVTKTPGNETGGAGEKIGAPGYEADGYIIGGGVSATLAI